MQFTINRFNFYFLWLPILPETYQCIMNTIVSRCLSVAVHSVSPYQLYVLNVCLWPMALCITNINACMFKTPSLSSCTKHNESIDFLMNVNKSFMYVYSFIHVILQLFSRFGSVHISNAIYWMAGKRLFINSLLSCTIS